MKSLSIQLLNINNLSMDELNEYRNKIIELNNELIKMDKKIVKRKEKLAKEIESKKFIKDTYKAINLAMGK